MKAKKLLGAIVAGGMLVGGWEAYAQDQAEKAEMIKSTESKDVAKDLDGPDGAAFRLLPNGYWQIFGQGSASYDFDDNDDIQSAFKEAQLKAKASIAKYLSEKLSTNDSLDELVKKTAQQSTGADKKVTRESVKTTVTSIQNSAEEILKGAIVLAQRKVSNSGSEGGTTVVKVGISSKSLAVAGKIKGDISSVSGKSTKGSKSDPKAKDVEEKTTNSDF